MKSLPIIKYFYVSKYISPSLVSVVVGLIVREFVFEIAEEAFRHGIIPTITFAAHTRYQEYKGSGLRSNEMTRPT
jgi:hypothetical protein